MQEVKLEKFNEQKAETAKLMENIKNTVATIDKEGNAVSIDIVKENKKIVRKRRTFIVGLYKEKRQVAVDYQKYILNSQKDELALIEPVEAELDEAIKAKEDEARLKLRIAQLPDKKDRLKEIELEVSDEELLAMDREQFNDFFFEKKDEYLKNKEEEQRIEREKKEAALKEKEAALKEKEDKIEADRLKLEEDERLTEAKKKATEEAQKKAILDAKIEKERVKKEAEEALRKAEQDKNDAIKAEKRKAEEKKEERLNEIEREKQIRAEAEAKLKAEEAKLKKQKTYTDWFKKNGESHEADNTGHLIIERTDNTFVMYRKVDEITIN